MSLGGFPGLQAKVAIVDPALTLTVPMKQVKAGGVDILSHLIEYYLTDDTPGPMTDGISETGMKMVVEYLPRAIAHPDDIRARTQLSWVSTVAMSKIARLGGGGGNMTCHAVEHALSGYYDVTHGEGLAALLPAWMRHFYRADNPRFNSLGKNVFGKKDGLKATEQFLESIGMRLRLGDLGCKIGRHAIDNGPGLQILSRQTCPRCQYRRANLPRLVLIITVCLRQGRVFNLEYFDEIHLTAVV